VAEVWVPGGEVTFEFFAINISLLAPCAFAFIAIPLDCANMLGNKTWDQWIEEYSRGHRHPVNRICHLLGIPIIVLSLVLILPGAFIPGVWSVAIVLFLIGWVFQFAGHIFERKPPEFFRDWRFLFVGLRWWVAKIRFR
jgi:uncharacterized membrane protein YGL010W